MAPGTEVPQGPGGGEHTGGQRLQGDDDNDMATTITTTATGITTSTTSSDLLRYIVENEEAFQSKRRLASLYSDFRFQASTNPDGYAANVTAWRRALAAAARAGTLPAAENGSGGGSKFCVRSGDHLARALGTREYGRPLALGAVFSDAAGKRDFMPLSEFLNSKTSIYGGGGVGGAIAWGLRKVGLGARAGGGEEKLVAKDYVIVENVEAAADAVLREIQSTTNTATSLIHSPQTFAARFSPCLGLPPTQPIAATDLAVLLTYLSRERRALAHTPTTIKLVPPHGPQPARPLPTSFVTASDVSVAQLRTLLLTLTAQTDALAARAADLTARARAAASASPATAASRAAALSALRSRKLVEGALAERSGALAQLEAVYAQIERAADNAAVVRVMRESEGALRRLNDEVGGAEGAERVAEGLRAEMERADEIGAVVNEVGEVGPGGAVVDEAEIDAEFERLERAEREKREREEGGRVAERFAETERLERERAEKEREREKGKAGAEGTPDEAGTEADVDAALKVMQRMSLDEAPTEKPETKEGETAGAPRAKEPVLAS